jgi:dTDP-4-dehydrorhamnose reductase
VTVHLPPSAWITGAAGLIGHHLLHSPAFPAHRWSPRPLHRADLDLLDFHAVDRLFHREQPAIIVHCAALSRSPDCQQHPALARRVNLEATAHLASLAQDIPLVFFSSDLVFDGRRGAYLETDAPNPLSVYGETKAEAEQVVLRNPHHTVIRTSLNAGSSPTGHRAFNEEMTAAWQTGRTLRLFTDEFRSPIPAGSTARAVWELANRDAHGLFHVAGAERLSRWEIGLIVARANPNLHPLMEPASLTEYSGAPRPADTSLNCSRVQKLLSFLLPSFRTWPASKEVRNRNQRPANSSEPQNLEP